MCSGRRREKERHGGDGEADVIFCTLGVDWPVAKNAGTVPTSVDAEGPSIAVTLCPVWPFCYAARMQPRLASLSPDGQCSTHHTANRNVFCSRMSKLGSLTRRVVYR